MTTDYSARLHALFQLEFFGMKLGLENIRALLEFLERPDRKFKSIHVAGTNGKGSVSAMLAAICTSAGFRTGLYTSPHLVDFRERIRVDGTMISESEVADFLERAWPKVEERKATFFEVTTAMAFDHFARHGVDIAIIETGLGGRLDATNVLEHPLATVIASIGMDHTQQLGPTLESIASEKAGIFKPDVPAIVNCIDSLRWVFSEKAKEVSAPIRFVQDFHVPDDWKGFQPSLVGEHQYENLRTVFATLASLNFTIVDSAIANGLEHTAPLTGLRARLEEMHLPLLDKREVRVMLDVGHNEDALLRVRDFFRERRIRPIVIFGIMQDKDIRRALEILAEFAAKMVAVHAETQRALPSAELNEQAIAAGIDSRDGGSVKDGFEIALRLAAPGDTILINGSHYVCGEFLQAVEP